MISLIVELPEPLQLALQEYLDRCKKSQDGAISAAISYFLMQEGCEDRAVLETFLNNIWQQE